MGSLQQPKENYERALDIRLRKLGPEHIKVKRTYNMLGSVQNRLKDPHEAKEYDERTPDIRVEELRLERRRVYRDLDAALPLLEDLHQGKEYHERAWDK